MAQGTTKKTKKQQYPTFDELAELVFAPDLFFAPNNDIIYSSYIVGDRLASTLSPIDPFNLSDQDIKNIAIQIKESPNYGNFAKKNSVDYTFVFKSFEQAAENLNDPAAKNFIDNFALNLAAHQVIRNFNGLGIQKQERILITFVKNLEQTKNDALKCDIESDIIDMNSLSIELRRQIGQLMLKNPAVTPAQLFQIQKLYSDGSKETEIIFSIAEKVTKSIIEKELGKKLTDTDAIANAFDYLKEIARRTKNQELINHVNDTYDDKKIILSTLNVEYLENIEKSSSLQLAEQAKEIEGLKSELYQKDILIKKQNNENEKIREASEQKDKIITQAREEKKKADELLMQTEHELRQMRAEKEALEAEMIRLRREIAKLGEQAEEMKASLLSRGVNNVRKKIFDLEVIAKAKEARGK